MIWFLYQAFTWMTSMFSQYKPFMWVGTAFSKKYMLVPHLNYSVGRNLRAHHVCQQPIQPDLFACTRTCFPMSISRACILTRLDRPVDSKDKHGYVHQQTWLWTCATKVWQSQCDVGGSFEQSVSNSGLWVETSKPIAFGGTITTLVFSKGFCDVH